MSSVLSKKSKRSRWTSKTSRNVLALISITALGAATTQSAAAGQTPEPLVIMIPGISGNPGYGSVICAAQVVAKKDHIDLTVQAANTFAPSTQTPILQAAIARHPAAIMIAPTDAVAMYQPIQAAVKAGIKVILFDTDLNNTHGTYSWIGVNNLVGGQLAATTMARLIGNKGQVLGVNLNRGASTSDQRQDGFIQRIKKYPHIDYLGTQYNQDDATAAASEVSAELAAHPDIAGIYGTNLTETQGVVTGIRNAGDTAKVKVVGFDASPPEVVAVQQGHVQALIAQDVRDEGTTAMQVTVDVLHGQHVKSTYLVGFYAIDKANVNTPAGRYHYYSSDCSL